MDIAFSIVLILHFIGLAGIIGGWLATIKAPYMAKGILHGAILQVVTGILLVGLREMQDADVNHMKIVIKLLIAIVILIVAIVGVRKEAKAPGTTATLAHVAGVLGIVNVAIAVLV